MKFSFALVVSLACIATPAFCADIPLSSKPTADTKHQVAEELASGDPAAVSQAELQIRQWISIRQVPFEIWHDWMPSELAAQRYQSVADLTLAAVLARPDAKWIDHLLIQRAKALLALNKAEEALEAAKGAYNVCEVNRLANATDVIATCLAKCHPDDPDIEQKFRNEQALATMSGDTAQSVDSMSQTQPSAQAKSTIMNSIHIDKAMYNESLRNWKLKAEGGKFRDSAYYGNLLMAVGEGAEAEKIYRDLYASAITDTELETATQGIAHALRTEDGNVARANAWILTAQASRKSKEPAQAPADSHLP